jgi:hypothetical protein
MSLCFSSSGEPRAAQNARNSRNARYSRDTHNRGTSRNRRTARQYETSQTDGHPRHTSPLHEIPESGPPLGESSPLIPLRDYEEWTSPSAMTRADLTKQRSEFWETQPKYSGMEVSRLRLIYRLSGMDLRLFARIIKTAKG